MAFNDFTMRSTRALVATDPRLFGRAARAVAVTAEERRWTMSEDLQLFAGTFAAGFLFVSILLA